MLIYKWTNKLNGKIYIGQTTKKLAHRTRMHINSSNAGSTMPIHNAIRKYGLIAFTIETIATASSIKELNQLEIQSIAANNCQAPFGYNLKNGGDNHDWHPASRAKASKSALKRIKSDGGEQLLAALAKGREILKDKPVWNKGKKATPEAILNQSIAHIGQIAWNKRSTFCVETGEIFPSLKAASIVLKLQAGHICNVLKGNRKSTGGLTFQYLVNNP